MRPFVSWPYEEAGVLPKLATKAELLLRMEGGAARDQGRVIPHVARSSIIDNRHSARRATRRHSRLQKSAAPYGVLYRWVVGGWNQ
mmetsp:Transcript_5881/g.17411  ORF Transcript_5881/g.17411 Transcript_5881/m.17411 type:complete len:86 (-) Transcript_5881:233-490(-)